MSLSGTASAPSAVWADGVPQPKMPYSPAVRAGDWLFVAGQLASDFQLGLPLEVQPANPYLVSPEALQGEFILKNLAPTVAAGGADLGRDGVRVSRWFTGADPHESGTARWAGRGVSDYLAVEAPYGVTGAGSSLGIGELMVLGTRVEIDVIARVDDAEPVVVTGPSGAPVGVSRGDWVFLGSQAPSPVTGWDPVDRQTHRLLDELGGLVPDATPVKAEVAVRDARDLPAFERAWRERYGDGGPARVVVTGAHPCDPTVDVEIALTLYRGADVEVVQTDDAPAPFGGGPQAVRAGDLLLLSGQIAVGADGAVTPGTTRSASFPWYGSPGRLQMERVLDDVATICAAGGSRLEHVVRRVCYHDDLATFAESIAAWSERFPGVKPASTTLRTAGPLPVPGATTLLDLIAWAGSPSTEEGLTS